MPRGCSRGTPAGRASRPGPLTTKREPFARRSREAHPHEPESNPRTHEPTIPTTVDDDEFEFTINSRKCWGETPSVDDTDEFITIINRGGPRPPLLMIRMNSSLSSTEGVSAHLPYFVRISSVFPNQISPPDPWFFLRIYCAVARADARADAPRVRHLGPGN